ncbi:ribonuclease [Chelativorans sp. AA-79]|uniref:ribonuclease T2 family protein n=1 Tax=Chelativorans sp. AA-79 TaxID=3028735 RepID=UPI0023F9A076|nr:ribonuclease [Chelativorans sp. AA-79]WEX07603.1 ribonuclease [Chelativorans sp. AA-79]
MRLRRWAAALFLTAATASPALPGERGAEPGTFDFYVLSLSWSPSYCAAEAEDANPEQCDAARPYAFVVHGLWPQFESGYPEFCPSRQPERVPRRLVEAYHDIVPSAGLIGHQWRKHGSCTGLGQEAYFALLREARGRIEIPEGLSRLERPLSVSPDKVEEEFRAANPGLDAAGIAVVCDGRYLREVRICMTRDLEFRPCEEVDEKSCRQRSVTMPPVR